MADQIIESVPYGTCIRTSKSVFCLDTLEKHSFDMNEMGCKLTFNGNLWVLNDPYGNVIYRSTNMLMLLDTAFVEVNQQKNNNQVRVFSFEGGEAIADFSSDIVPIYLNNALLYFKMGYMVFNLETVSFEALPYLGNENVYGASFIYADGQYAMLPVQNTVDHFGKYPRDYVFNNGQTIVTPTAEHLIISKHGTDYPRIPMIKIVDGQQFFKFTIIDDYIVMSEGAFDGIQTSPSNNFIISRVAHIKNCIILRIIPKMGRQ